MRKRKRRENDREEKAIETVRYIEKSVRRIVLTPFGVLCSIVVEPEQRSYCSVSAILVFIPFARLNADAFRYHCFSHAIHYTFFSIRSISGHSLLFFSICLRLFRLAFFSILLLNLPLYPYFTNFCFFSWLHFHLFALFGRSLGK